MASALVVLAVEGRFLDGGHGALAAIVVGAGLSILHVLSVRKRIGNTTLALDAVGTAVLLAGTGAPLSPFYVFALAGVWWAAHVPRPRTAALYAFALTATYAILVWPPAARDGMLGEGFKDTAVLIILAALADWFVRVDRRALALNDALSAAPFSAEQLAIRQGLTRALGTVDVPVDVVLAAGQVGLTALQAELLAYLSLGLTNIEISDAIGVSEAAVRYRLTALYRVLDVRGRKPAAERARSLGLSRGEKPLPGRRAWRATAAG